jgi:hypothetical protein
MFKILAQLRPESSFTKQNWQGCFTFHNYIFVYNIHLYTTVIQLGTGLRTLDWLLTGELLYKVFQLDFEIFTTIASFIKISSGH